MLALLMAVVLTPAEVLAKARAATGTQDAGTYQLEERMTTGNQTISIVKVTQGENYAQTERNGEISTADGRIDGVYWTQDANGVVLTRSGASVSDDPYLDALKLPESANVVRVDSGADGSVVLAVTPRAGMIERRSYDPDTFLLRSIEYDDPRGHWKQSYSNYKQYFGLTIPTNIASTNLVTGSSTAFDVVSYDRLSPGSVSLAIPPSRPVFDIGSQTSVPIPAEFSTTGIVVRVSINGQGLDFVLDPHSESTLDTGVAHQLGLDAHHESLAYWMGETFDHAVVDDFELGDLRAKHFALLLRPYSLHTDLRNIVGILGNDFFANGRVAVDFGAKTVTLIGATTKPPEPGWSALPLEVTGSVPLMTAKFNGIPGSFAVELVASQTILFKHYFANFTPGGPGVVLGKKYGSGDYAYQTFTLSRVNIGDLTLADPVVQVVDRGVWADSVGADGMLGSEVWGNFSMIFDYADRTLYLKPLRH